MKNWLRRLIKWVREFWRRRQPVSPTPSVEAHWSNWYGDLYRLYRGTPEAVPYATYRFVPAYREGHFLLTCDRYSYRRDARGNSLSPGLQGVRNGAPAPGHPVPSHRLSLTRIQTVGNLVKVRVLFSYPVDFVGTKGHTAAWRAQESKILTPETLERDNLMIDRNAILITAELAELLTQKYQEEIDWETEIHTRAERLGASHLILLNGRRAL